MELEVFDGWTIDRRLKQLRKIREKDDKILFVDFDSDLGQAIFEKKILLDEMDELLETDEWLNNAKSLDVKNLLLNNVSEVIKKLERELKWKNSK